MTDLSECLREELSAGRIDEADDTIAKLDQGGDERGAVLGRLVLAIRRHDSEAVRLLAASPEAQILRKEPKTHLLLAGAVRATQGIAAAGPEFESLCANRDVPADDMIKQEACCLANLARLSRGRPMHHIEIPQVAEVPFAKGHELAIIMASLNRLKREFFIVDTGAPTSLLNLKFCERNGIPFLREYMRIAHDAGGNPLVLYPALVDRLELGDVLISNWPVEVAEFPANFKVAGILSPADAFRGLGVEFEMRGRVLRILPNRKAAEWVERAREPVHSATLIWDDGKCFVRATVNQEAGGWFLLDSGSAGNFVTPELAKALGHDAASGGRIESLSAGGRVSIFPGFTGRLSVGDSEMAQTELMIANPASDAETILPLTSSGVIGIPWMEGRRVFLPPDGQSIIFTEKRL